MADAGQWLKAWRELGVADSPELRRLFRDVLLRYSEPHRHYHTQQHLAECFEKAQDIISLAEHPAEVLVGLWFHDAIYDTQRSYPRSSPWQAPVHCVAGTGRTDTVIACTLRALGFSLPDVLDDMTRLNVARDRRAGWPESEWQLQQVRRWPDP